MSEEKTIIERLALKIKSLPDNPGVYIMKHNGNIIYVGKAVNLKNRVRSYFQSSRGHTPKVADMVQKIDDFDIVLTDTELEAFILECTLIRKHRPHYNILLKDGGGYPYIRIDLSEDFPRVTLTHTIVRDGSTYFGPYIGATSVREILAALRSVFPLRMCEKQVRAGKINRPCVHHDIGQCPAPCAGKISIEDYRRSIDKVIDFLSGKEEDIVDDLTRRMMEAARAMRYEEAALLRDRIERVKKAVEKQKLEHADGEDRDVLAIAGDGLDVIVQLLYIRGGKMIGAEQFEMPRAGDERTGDILAAFIGQHYLESQVPKEVLCQELPEDSEALEAFLCERRGKRVRLLCPARGEKKKLVEMAEKNASDAMKKATQEAEKKYIRTLGACEELGRALGLESAPRRIEAFDISNIQGMLSVASMVVFVDGEPKNSEYRRFRIKTVEGANDFASMAEVIGRRFRRGQMEIDELETGEGKFSSFPDVILIDGGKIQLEFALDAMRETGGDVPMFGLAKRLEEILLPDREEPVVLPRHSPALHLIQRVRDEAHRFAITYHRSLRGKQGLRSQLENIPGVGKKRVKALFYHFKTVKAIKSATLDELSSVQGMTRPAAQNVFTHFHKADNLETEPAASGAQESMDFQNKSS